MLHIVAIVAVLSGQILVHDAFPGVFANYPQRQQVGVDGYIATNDCGEMGQRFVLVRPGQPDALVAVADCAAAQHVDWRLANDYIADVGTGVWRGPWVPQYAELWDVEDRAEYWQRLSLHSLEE